MAQLARRACIRYSHGQLPMTLGSQQDVKPVVLTYARQQGGGRFAPGMVIALLSIAGQVAVLLLLVRAVERAGEGIAAVKLNPSRFGRLVDAEWFAEIDRVWIEYLLAMGLFACVSLLTAALSTWFLVGLIRCRSDDGLGVLCRRFGMWKLWLTVAWSVTMFWSLEINRGLWEGLTAHHTVGSGPPIIETMMFGGWGVLVALFVWLHGDRLKLM